MKKVIIYTTTTGNTEIMAKAIADGARESGAEVVCSSADSVDPSLVDSADILYLGSPAMGDEVLDDPMEDFYVGIEGRLSGKKVAIFGSYDWGDGQWLRDWADRIRSAGGTVVNGEGTMCNLAPDDAGVAECKALGAQ
ncbi:flavodoxin [Methanomassiliicoccaceae archaeon COG_1]|nr:flavodoxin [Methanomassiliicoccaceae archaeon COG_1]